MWYEKAFRRHLCDMHIEDWHPDFLAQFDPSEYLENLKRAKIQNAMIYFQSHVGLCNFPTKVGKMHNAFRGKEDRIKKLTELCREAGISVTGYYSLIYNNVEHDRHPDWRMVMSNGYSKRGLSAEIAAKRLSAEKAGSASMESEFAGKGLSRYGFCCPNNMEYRAFVTQQIKEMAEYFTFDGIFFDMLFWPHMCYCDSCKERWAKEVGGQIPVKEDLDDPAWILHMKKRREWMGEFAMWATKEMKAVAPHASVEHNYASGVTPSGGLRCVDEAVNEACDYVGGDLYGNIYRHSFTCKYYRNITKNQPFEYMFSRCEPSLAQHTTLKSKDVMRSAAFLTAAHHGATLVIDAIDPVGTLDKRVYEQIGEVFEEQIPYEPYFTGEMIEDVGIYYSLKSKFARHKEEYFNHGGSVNAMETLVRNHVSCGVTGGYAGVDKYQAVIASLLSDEDAPDNESLIRYVKEGGCLYFSGGDNAGLLKEFFGGTCEGRTRERVIYLAPKDVLGGIWEDNKKLKAAFGRFNQKYPMHFDGTAPIVNGIEEDDVIATITLPYTHQDEMTFASIHSNPPGVSTMYPAMAIKKYGKGTVLWSALPIECLSIQESRRFFIQMLKAVFDLRPSISSNAPKDVEIIGFTQGDKLQINAVLLNEDYEARWVQPFEISVRCGKEPAAVKQLPDGREIPFSYKDGIVTFAVSDLSIFAMYEICVIVNKL